MISLRDYQERDLEKIRNSYRTGHRAPLYQAPPGAGKTRMFARICSGAAQRGTRVLILAHRTELVDQISGALSDESCAHSYIAAGYPYSLDAAVYVASVFSAVRQLSKVQPDLIVVDEAHHAAQDTTWGKILTTFPQAKILGVTATPHRLSGEGLDHFFDDLIIGPTHDELIGLGFLTPCRVYAPPSIDTVGLKTRAGDYEAGPLAARSDTGTVTGCAIEHYRRHTPGARAIVFDASVEAARRRADAFRSAGFTAACIDGKTERSVRALACADFRSGRIQILTSCDLVSEGFDIPACEVGISLRPTQSLSLWLQQSGRILRPFPGKTAAVLFDHAGNTLRHGLPTETRAWSLAGAAAIPHGLQHRASLRTCPSCFAVSPGGAVVCRSCGLAFPVTPREIHERKGTLEEITAEDLIRRRQKNEQGEARTLEALTALGRQRGMKHPRRWAEYVMKARARKRRVS